MRQMPIPPNDLRYERISGYKYRLLDPYSVEISILGFEGEVKGGWVGITRNGLLEYMRGYGWDGPSGPTIDTEDSLRAALVHDALYQLLREEILPRSYRKKADRIFRRILKADGMPLWRRWYWYQAVRWFAQGSARPR